MDSNDHNDCDDSLVAGDGAKDDAELLVRCRFPGCGLAAASPSVSGVAGSSKASAAPRFLLLVEINSDISEMSSSLIEGIFGLVISRWTCSRGGLLRECGMFLALLARGARVPGCVGRLC